VALVARGAGGERITAVNALAQAEGHGPGQSLADARALTPTLLCFPDDPDADDRDLRRLALWCGRFSPLVSVHPPTAGAAHLFGDEAGLVAEIRARFSALEIAARLALADTPGAAYARAAYDPGADEMPLTSPGAGLAALKSLPVAALRLAPKTVENLRAVGLKRVGELMGAPRASLARRFGPAPAARLDQAQGARGEALAPVLAPPLYQASLRLAEPFTTLPALEEIARRLVDDLVPVLEAAGVGLRRGVLLLYRVDGAALALRFAAARPQAKAETLTRLLKERLAARAEHLDLGFGVEAASLWAQAVEGRAAQPVDLDPSAQAAAAAAAGFADLADRLRARLGQGAVLHASPRASWIPERAARFTAAPGAQAFANEIPRPLLLMKPEPISAMAEVPDGAPRRLTWRRVEHRVARASGPERIAAEWWRADGPTRDYYRVETTAGQRLWLYREGLYGRETDTPRWFVQGVFA
jgi:protein ImuB